MTKVFDDTARNVYAARLFNDEIDYKGHAVREMEVREVSARFAREYIATYHYTRTMPDSTRFIYAGYFGSTLAGIICFGMGTGKNQYTAIIPTIQNGEYVELTRLWSPDGMPRNTESRLIGQAMKLLPAEIKLVLSFADPSRGHEGYIYQATNFSYCGMSNGGKMLLTADGIEKHPRLLGIYRMRHPELKHKTADELMQLYGWGIKDASGKHRYVYLRGTRKERKEMARQLQGMIKPYPKLKGSEIQGIENSSGQITDSGIVPLSIRESPALNLVGVI
jgi:hypothetical protein